VEEAAEGVVVFLPAVVEEGLEVVVVDEAVASEEEEEDPDYSCCGCSMPISYRDRRMVVCHAINHL
jgi:hypothetical protein